MINLILFKGEIKAQFLLLIMFNLLLIVHLLREKYLSLKILFKNECNTINYAIKGKLWKTDKISNLIR